MIILSISFLLLKKINFDVCVQTQFIYTCAYIRIYLHHSHKIEQVLPLPEK